MISVEVGTQVKLSNILYLTDFSEASEAALPSAIAIAREYGSRVYAMHILLPDPYVSLTPEVTDVVCKGLAEAANAKMRRIEARLTGLPHQILVEPGLAVWPTVQRAVKDNDIDLIVLGTRGRTGFKKFLLGSVAEDVLRRSDVPVLTIGPGVRGGAHHATRFGCVLFATDFSSASAAAAPYAISIAEENQARLILFHVIQRLNKKDVTASERSVADTMHQLYEILPKDAEFRERPEPIVEYGDPAEMIVAAANRRGADLIVLGVRQTGHLGVTTHLERTTAHHVVAYATCPVLTVRG